jgi:hypothetical protein
VFLKREIKKREKRWTYKKKETGINMTFMTVTHAYMAQRNIEGSTHDTSELPVDFQ